MASGAASARRYQTGGLTPRRSPQRYSPLEVGPRLAAAALALDLERLAGQVLQGLLLVVGERLGRVGHRVLAQRLHLGLGVGPGLAALEQLAPLLGEVVVDRLELRLLVVGQLEGRLNVLVGEHRDAFLLPVDLLQAL